MNHLENAYEKGVQILPYSLMFMDSNSYGGSGKL
jgi:hypothetical protein